MMFPRGKFSVETLKSIPNFKVNLEIRTFGKHPDPLLLLLKCFYQMSRLKGRYTKTVRFLIICFSRILHMFFFFSWQETKISSCQDDYHPVSQNKTTRRRRENESHRNETGMEADRDEIGSSRILDVFQSCLLSLLNFDLPARNKKNMKRKHNSFQALPNVEKQLGSV